MLGSVDVQYNNFCLKDLFFIVLCTTKLELGD